MEVEERKLVEIGKVTHYFSKIGVAVVKLKAPLSVGDRILIRGSTTNFEQTVTSMQIEHKNIDRAEAGQEVGLKVADRVRVNDTVYRIV
ncbi:MAG: translation elongation factor-like protein [archaeon GB-1867-097]|nr:translation elongation factor-like protein [Candidatus Culexmicrobium thermophilum]RLE55892.1 MAG: translation elongation factor-like protein [Candidatus Verstraetearchaeota archaeon]